jgi:hypothetical protein
VVCELLIGCHLGETMLAAFPSLQADWRDEGTLLRGAVRDPAELYGIIAQVEALGLELLEVRRVPHG